MSVPHAWAFNTRVRSWVTQWVLFTFMVTLIGGHLAWFAYSDHQRIDRHERARLQSQVNIVDLNLERQLLVIDRSLRALRDVLPILQSQPDAKKLLKARLQAMAEAQPGVPTMLIVNREGICIASNRDELVGQNFREGERFKTMSQRTNPDRLYISAPFLSPLKTFVISAGKILQDSRGNSDGYILAVIQLEFYETLLQSVSYAPDMQAAIIHRQGKVIARLPDPQKLVGTDLSLTPGFFTQHMQGGSRTTVQLGESLATGESRLTVMQTVRGASPEVDQPMVVALSRDPVHIFAEWRRRAIVMGSTFGLLVMLCGLGLLIHQRRKLDLGRVAYAAELRRRQAEETLRASEEHLRVTLQSIGDAVIMTNLEGIITHLNPAAERLTAWPKAEAIGRPFAQVFRTISALTRIAITNPVTLVLEKGEVVRLANHTILIARDGREYQIADSASPIRGGDGIVSGVVVVFSDVTEQYAAQAELGHREALLSTLTQRANIGMIMLSPDHRYLFANAAFGQMFELDVNGIAGKHVGDIWPGTYESPFRPGIDRAFASQGGTYEFLHRAGTGEQREIWYEVSFGPPVETAQGPCAIGLITDITARKEAAQRLAQLAAIVEHTTDAIVVRDRDDVVVSWNLAAENLFGWSAQEAIGRMFRPLLSATAEPDKRRRFEKVLRGELVPTMEDIRRHKNGTILTVDMTMSAAKNTDGEIVGVSCIMRDVSARKQAQEARNQLAAIVENAHDAIYSRSLDGRILTWNGGAERMFGYTATEAIGRPVTFTLAPGEKSSLPDNNKRLLRGETLSLEMRRMTKSGREITVLTSLSPIKNAEGITINASLIMHDITALRQAQAASEAFEAQLREAQKMQAIGTLAGGVAHDFNNIIATINGNVQLAQQDTSGSRVAEYLREIQKAANHARDLVRQILSFSRKQPIQMRLIALEPVVQESARLLRATLPQRIALDVLCPGATPRVLADATLIQQIILNLCTNAMHAIPEGRGTITISLETVQVDHELSEAMPALKLLCERRPGLAASIVVTDTGMGMDTQTLSRIFEPFFTTKAVNEGTGLGLSVVHGIVEAHQGAIVVESLAGKGTTFSIFIPESTDTILTEPAPAPMTARVTLQGIQGKVRILHIDDDLALAPVISSLLISRGYDVKSFTNSQEALREFQQRPESYNIILTDHNMPHMTGVELAREVRALRQDVPVVLSSGYIDDALLASARSAGVREVISKEADFDELATLMSKLASSQLDRGG